MFYSNNATGYGGALTLIGSSFNSTIIGNTFLRNKCGYSGSAMALANIKSLSIKNNIFQRNYAMVSAAVYWQQSSDMIEPYELTMSNIFGNGKGMLVKKTVASHLDNMYMEKRRYIAENDLENSALFGPNYGTETYSIKLSNADDIFTNPSSIKYSVEQYSPTYSVRINASLVDYYGHRNTLIADNQVVQLVRSKSYNCPGNTKIELDVNNKIYYTVVDYGAFSFSNINPTCAPGGVLNYTILFHVSTQIGPIDKLNKIQYRPNSTQLFKILPYPNIYKEIELNYRECKLGYITSYLFVLTIS
jgi:hypothetical protein